MHSTNFVHMPSRPATIIQNVAPAPPRVTAIATPAMFPRPTVPETALESAWKWVTSPGSSARSYRPRASPTAWLNPRAWMPRKTTVKTIPASTSQPTISGKVAPATVTSKNTTAARNSATGAKTLSMASSTVAIAPPAGSTCATTTEVCDMRGSEPPRNGQVKAQQGDGAEPVMRGAPW